MFDMSVSTSTKVTLLIGATALFLFGLGFAINSVNSMINHKATPKTVSLNEDDDREDEELIDEYMDELMESLD